MGLHTATPRRHLGWATHCNTLQHTATHCNALQHATTHCNTLASHCNTLQHTATHCNTLQHTATHCNTLKHPEGVSAGQFVLQIYSMQCVAVYCSVLQRVAECCSVLQSVAMCCSVLHSVCCGANSQYTTLRATDCMQHTATQCNTL